MPQNDDDDTLSTLFARDPLSLSDTDIDRIITAYTAARKNFITNGKTAAPKPTASLADLGLT
jgi:hypothetical protein